MPPMLVHNTALAYSALSEEIPTHVVPAMLRALYNYLPHHESSIMQCA